MKDELDRKIRKLFAGLKAKTYGHLINGGNKDKKAKDTTKSVIKLIEFENYKNFLEATQLENKINYLE